MLFFVCITGFWNFAHYLMMAWHCYPLTPTRIKVCSCVCVSSTGQALPSLHTRGAGARSQCVLSSAAARLRRRLLCPGTDQPLHATLGVPQPPSSNVWARYSGFCFKPYNISSVGLIKIHRFLPPPSPATAPSHTPSGPLVNQADTHAYRHQRGGGVRRG